MASAWPAENRRAEHRKRRRCRSQRASQRSRASQRERAAAMNTATQYLKLQGKPITTPVSVIKEGSGVKSPTFKKIFAN